MREWRQNFKFRLGQRNVASHRFICPRKTPLVAERLSGGLLFLRPAMKTGPILKYLKIEGMNLLKNTMIKIA
jgi:hypothetical protein